MQTLEFCYEFDCNKINFIERKIKIIYPKTIVYGSPRSGKTYLIYDYLSNFQSKDYIYIDLYDIRNDRNNIIKNLNEFIINNNIKILVLENFEFDFELPICKHIILSTCNNESKSGFEKLLVKALDFEEYILHNNKHQNITNSFNSFLKHGNLPEMININNFNKVQRLQEIISLCTQNTTEEEILKILFLNIDEKKSLFQLFLILKENIKISKDKFYKQCKVFEEKNIIYFIKKYQQNNATKKIYSYNHSFINVLSHTKKLKNEFSNMVFLELNNRYDEIYYLDNIDFYITSHNLAIIVIPFFSINLNNNLLKKIYKSIDEWHFNEINIITISNNDQVIYKNKKINILSFYEWSLA